ncbi:hypothetical protein [Thorsellia kenyensis]|uniref:Uncharacterized protein n=1 Tax=Thorsellia kenyensis TaxID=1549888 RepID=A0ABV6CAQ0_9GAMM
MTYAQQQCVDAVIPPMPEKLDVLDYLDEDEYTLIKNPLVLDIDKACVYEFNKFYQNATRLPEIEFIPVDIFSYKNKTYILYYSKNDVDSANDDIRLVEFSGLTPISYHEVSKFASGEDAYLHIYSEIQDGTIKITKVLLDKSSLEENSEYDKLGNITLIFKNNNYLEKLPFLIESNKIPLNIYFNESLGNTELSMENAFPLFYFSDAKNNLFRLFKFIDKSYFIIDTEQKLYFSCPNVECKNQSTFITNGQIVSTLDKENPYDKILVEYLAPDGKLTSGLLLKENLKPITINEIYHRPFDSKLTLSDFILSDSGKFYSLDNKYEVLNELLTNTDKFIFQKRNPMEIKWV